jgi:hypothetical protein
MSKPNRNDISIGKDKWITFIELGGRQSSAIELDGILRPIEPFLNSLETECVAACCGIDAYALWPEDIARAAKQSGIPDLSESIDVARQRIVDTRGDSFVSHRMNNYFDRQTLLQLVDHIAHCVRHADDVGEQSDEREPD